MMQEVPNQSDKFEMEFYEKLIGKRPDYVDALIPLAEAYTRCRLYKKGLSIDRRLAKLCPYDAIIYYNLACSYSLMSKERSALTALRKAIKLGYRDFEHMKKDADLKSLHSNATFKKLMMLKKKRPNR